MKKMIFLLTIIMLGIGFFYRKENKAADITNTVEKIEIKPKVDIQPKTEPTNYAEALKQSKNNNKNILLVFSATWCGPCNKFKSEVLKDENVKKKMNDYIFLIIDIDAEPVLTKKCNVTAIPSILILNNKEEIIKSTVGFKDKKSFINWFE